MHIHRNRQITSKDKRIQTKLLNFSFEVFNADKIKNEEVTRIVSLEIKVNSHKE